MISDYYANALGNLMGFDRELFERALDRWTERSQLGDGYDRRILKLYDALIWTRVENTKDELRLIKNSIKYRDKTRTNSSNFVRSMTPKTNNDLLIRLHEIEEDIKSWKYTGRLYRVINCKESRIEYHQLIASWVKNPKAFKDFNQLCKSQKYSFLIGKTGRDWAFDVNMYRKHTENRHPNTEYETEVILPMNQKYIVDLFYGTLEEFYRYIKN